MQIICQTNKKNELLFIIHFLYNYVIKCGKIKKNI